MRQGLYASWLVVLLAAGTGLAEPALAPPAPVPPALIPETPALVPAPPDAGADSAADEGRHEASHSTAEEIYGLPLCGWFNAEYLLWLTKSGPVVPLVTAAPAGARPTLDQPTTSVLYGDKKLEYDGHSGGRFTGGAWFNLEHTAGAEISYFFLGPHTIHFVAAAPGTPGEAVLARPFFNVATGAEDAVPINFPGFSRGGIAIGSSSSMQSAEVTGICNLRWEHKSRLDLLAGFRYLEMKEDIGIQQVSLGDAANPLVAGSEVASFDSFAARNRFYAFQLGLRGEWVCRRWEFHVSEKLALGSTEETILTDGATYFGAPGGATRAPLGGLLVVPGGNLARFNRNEFAVVPETSLSVSYRLYECLHLSLGYNFLYWSNVVRPGDAIDFGVNPALSPLAARGGSVVPARPAFAFHNADFWAQGLTLGLEFRF